MADCYKDMFDWLKNNQDKVFRFAIYRRMFTPYEQDKKFSDESEYEDGGYYEQGKISEIIQLPNDYLIGFRLIDIDYYDDSVTERKEIKYVRLSEIRLSCFDTDNEGGEDLSERV